MQDPRQRLERLVMGDRFHAERPMVTRALSRGEGAERVMILRDHPMLRDGEAAVGHSVRDTKKIAPVWANAPQLIRVVKHPFALSKVAFSRAAAVDRRPEKREERVRLKVELASLHDEGRQPFPMPSRLRYRVEARPRLRTAGWPAPATPAREDA